jgi:MFS family permease
MVDPNNSDSSTWATIITTVCSIGAAIGAISSGVLAKYGKWKCIILNNIVVCIGAGITLYDNEYVITVGRFIYGLSNGAFSVFVPLYINETAPVELKGPLGVMT